MKITAATILLSGVSFFEVYRTFVRIKKERIGIRAALVWLCMWFGIGFFALFPSLTDHFRHIVQMENRMFFILLVAVLVLFTLVFNLFSKIDLLERRIAQLIQNESLVTHDIDQLKEDVQQAEE